MPCRPERLEVLAAYLRRHYPPRHRIVLYEAAQFPTCDSKVERIALARLADQAIFPMTTVYVPPRPARELDPKILAWFR